MKCTPHVHRRHRPHRVCVCQHHQLRSCPISSDEPLSLLLPASRIFAASLAEQPPPRPAWNFRAGSAKSEKITGMGWNRRYAMLMPDAVSTGEPAWHLNRLYFSCFTSTIAFFFRYTSPRRLSSQSRATFCRSACVFAVVIAILPRSQHMHISEVSSIAHTSHSRERCAKKEHRKQQGSQKTGCCNRRLDMAKNPGWIA